MISQNGGNFAGDRSFSLIPGREVSDQTWQPLAAPGSSAPSSLATNRSACVRVRRAVLLPAAALPRAPVLCFVVVPPALRLTN
jgi:hypothetical protein